jgi:hypothetical protein
VGFKTVPEPLDHLSMRQVKFRSCDRRRAAIPLPLLREYHILPKPVQAVDDDLPKGSPV